MPKPASSVDYQALAEFRYQIRRFLTFSQQAARADGIDPQQHQLLLAIRGLPEGIKPSIRALAERLQIRHHSAVELIDRSVAHGLVQRQRDGIDRRQVTIHLTPKGERLLSELSLHHRDELRHAGRELARVLRSIIAGSNGSPRRKRVPSTKYRVPSTK
ncbi:MAG TPA: MarR family winged helix-turn-helix transcriptional regulator [Terriglobales bacterium]|nr:MarR family winged helix-turn-helix transcriptional regulator [Terriglobales bacterium]